MESVFVYGTLRPGGAAADKMVECRWLGPATVKGSLYQIDWYPGLILEGEGEVKGDLVLVPPDCMDQLDAYEACLPNDLQPHEYRRVKGTVRCPDGSEKSAWIWEYQFSVDEKRCVESGDWFEREA